MSEKREYPRFPCFVKADVIFTGRNFEMTAVDVSLTGLRLQSRVQPSFIVKEEVEIFLQHGFFKEGLTLSGLIVYSLKQERNLFLFGVQITQLDEEVSQLWDHFVTLMREQSIMLAKMKFKDEE